jgi:hypothetical protein
MRRSAALAGIFLAAALAATSPSKAASNPDRILQAVKQIPPIEFVVARGAANACGPGCDSWIAAEGLIDERAAARLRRVLDTLGGRKLPVFFYSPGGDTVQGLAIGRMLRKRGLTAGVAVTVPDGCMRTHEVEQCRALMREPQMPEAALLMDGASCNSACAYAILGAVKREIAPTAQLGVHSGYSYLSFASPEITRRQRAQALERGRQRIAREVQRYLTEMGIDRDLFRIASATKFESLHFLTRAELFDLGIDRREVADSGWHFSDLRASSLGGSMLTTLATKEKGTVTTDFRQVALAISCATAHPESYQVTTIALVPDAASAASQTDIHIASGAVDLRLPAAGSVRRTGNGKTFEIRQGQWPRPLLERLLLASPTISFVDTAPRDERSVQQDEHAAAASRHPLSGLAAESSLKALAGRCSQGN